jgi:hypothetical protein
MPMERIISPLSFESMRFEDPSLTEEEEKMTDSQLIKSPNYLARVSKIYRTLSYAGWEHARIIHFASTIQRVFDRENGKKNAIVLIGPSNSGKSQLMNSLLNLIAPRGLARPNNNPRDVFQFSSCLNARAILWEEPYISIDNIETVKLILGGDVASIQVKYQDPQFMHQIPTFITTNRGLSSRCVGHEQELKNRVEIFYLGCTTYPDNTFPIDSYDWDIYLNLCCSKLRDRSLKLRDVLPHQGDPIHRTLQF